MKAARPIHSAHPTSATSQPLTAPAPWIFRRRSTGELLVVVSKTFFDARERAPLLYVERYRAPEPPDDLEVHVNPINDPESAERLAELARAPVKIRLRADCIELPRVVGFDEVRQRILNTEIPLRVNGSAVPWADGFEPRKESP